MEIVFHWKRRVIIILRYKVDIIINVCLYLTKVNVIEFAIHVVFKQKNHFQTITKSIRNMNWLIQYMLSNHQNKIL